MIKQEWVDDAIDKLNQMPEDEFMSKFSQIPKSSMLPPWIVNVPRGDVERGTHMDPGPNSVLIQITDPDIEFPEPHFQFRRVEQFTFADVETEDEAAAYGRACDREDARRIALILQESLADHSNVIVHCTAGLCRSGAVVEVGVMLGFRDTDVARMPNMLVKKLLITELGWSY